ncbi:hypothetical protein [Jiella sonneratiae]|uniref:Uncharacterized protein n=1 Tax=Jiella sonneratiae TaxID=2816856 RepID=A0ABS3J8G6_9HYPH|nr:hypothetical protein [Jiella sonneratiae]MBO0905961.1 hypothetical protein [Jiella sonneratiae]
MAADDLSPMLAILAARIRRHREARQASDLKETQRLELSAALRRFGAAGAGIAAACRDDDPSRLDPAERAAVALRVSRELHRQARFSRGGDPRYDINRHIVVARLARWLTTGERWLKPPDDPARRPSTAKPSRPGRQDRIRRQGEPRKPARPGPGRSRRRRAKPAGGGPSTKV